MPYQLSADMLNQPVTSYWVLLHITTFKIGNSPPSQADLIYNSPGLYHIVPHATIFREINMAGVYDK